MGWLRNGHQRTDRAPEGDGSDVIMVLAPILALLIWAAIIYAMVAML